MLHLYAQGAHLATSPSLRLLIAAFCSARGIRMTPLRAHVLELVAGSPRPVKAYELLDFLRNDRGRAAPPTVYRTLDFLVRHGLVRKLATTSAFVVCRQPGVRFQAPLLICQRCGEVAEIDSRWMDEAVEAEARKRGFRPTLKTLEIHGLCVRCGSTPTAEAVPRTTQATSTAHPDETDCFHSG